MTDYSDITDSTTIRILNIILSEPKSLTEISNSLNISRPEISRCLTKMRKISLVEKEENLNAITFLGSLIAELLSPLDFILLHYLFFQDHPFINFPSELLYGLKKFQHSKLMSGTGTIFQKFIEYANINHNNLKIMLATPMPNIANVIYEEGNVIVPIWASSPILKDDQLSKVILTYEIRRLPEVNYDMFILDNKFGFLYFPDKFGSPDNNNCFFIDDIEGMNFLLLLWNYFWEKSTLDRKSNTGK